MHISGADPETGGGEGKKHAATFGGHLYYDMTF